MKKSFLILFVCAFCFLFVDAHTLTMEVTVFNDWTVRKSNEPIVIDMRKIKELKWHVTKAIVELKGKEVPCQLDDMDGDWRADELVFLTDIEASEKQVFDVTLYSEGKQREYEPRVYAHMSIGSKSSTDITAFETPGSSNIFNNLYHHGACFESELVGFRIYSDSRQNVDIYGKKKRQLELATTKFNSTGKHLSAGYGHDVLWNGKSLACGTLRGWHNGIQEVLDVKRRGQRILAYGPLRTVVEVADLGWCGNTCLRTRYTLYAGHRDVEVLAYSDEPLPTDLYFCTGVQKIGSSPQGMLKPDGIAASWGKDWPDYGKKDIYEEQSVGLAVFIPTEYIYNMVEDSLNFVFVINAAQQHSFKYWLSFCADMEEDSPYHSAKAWFSSLNQWRDDVSHPVKITSNYKYKTN